LEVEYDLALLLVKLNFYSPTVPDDLSNVGSAARIVEPPDI